MSNVLRPGGSPSSRSGRSERRILSLMFCDVANSTSLAENIDPEEWVEIMNEAFEHMTAPILRYEGTIGKFTGDGMMMAYNAAAELMDMEFQQFFPLACYTPPLEMSQFTAYLRYF